MGEYQGGTYYGESLLSWGDASEGYGDMWFGTIGSGVRSKVKNFEVDSVLNIDPSGGTPMLEVMVEGVLRDAHDLTMAVVTPAGAVRDLEKNIIFSPWGRLKKFYPLQISDIAADGKVKLRFTILDKGVADIVRVRYLRVTYSRKNEYTLKNLVVSPVDTLKNIPSLFNIKKTSAQTLLALDITDPYTIKKLAVNNQAALATVVAPAPNGQKQTILFADQSYIIAPVAPIRTTFRNLAGTNSKYLFIYHKRLAVPAANGINPVKAYADYRASAVGGQYDTLSLEIGKIYDQFHYGEKSANAVRHLIHYLRTVGQPAYVLLLGKALLMDYGSFGRTRSMPTPASIQRDMVPTGFPASDIFFTSDWEKDSYFPQIATGRVAAETPDQVAAYLEKVQEHEALPNNLEWRKNVLHLGGGDNDQLKAYIRNAMDKWKNMVQGSLWGADVKTIYRLNTSGTERLNVAPEINAGLSLVTFFGHSSAQTNDLDIGRVSDPANGYNNQGKYPMMIMNGCTTGNPFVDNNFGVDWLLTPKKGIILYLAHTATGYANLLQLYTEKFYELAFTDSAYYGKPVGNIQQEVIKQFMARTQSPQAIAQAMQMLLQGDPALRLFSPEKPDYLVKENGPTIIPFKNERLTAALDSFMVAIPVRNLGKALPDSFAVSVTRHNTVVVDSVFFPAVFNQDTLFVKFVDRASHTAGINQFTIVLDHLNKISELDETNNTYSFEVYFPSDDVQALYPPEYSIVPDNKVKLVGQVTNLQSKKQDYYFELDVSPQFNSPQKQTNTVVGAGSLPIWSVTLPPAVAPNDSVVYFWRFRAKDLPPGQDSVVWGQSSFRYIAGSPAGWSQSQPAQFRAATTTSIALDDGTQKWEFTPNIKNLVLKTIGGAVTAGFPPYGIFIDRRTRFDATCGLNRPNVLAVVFEDKTLEPYAMPVTAGGTLCGTVPKNMYHFTNLSLPANQEKLRLFLESVPAGYHVALISVLNVPFTTFSQPLKQAFRSLGSRLIDSVQTGYPLALLGRKGAAVGTAQENTYLRSNSTPPNEQAVELTASIQTRGVAGAITSTLVGPATAWNQVYYHVIPNGAGKDNFLLTVRGYDAAKTRDTLLYEKVNLQKLDLTNLKASRFPYLRLELAVSDSLDRTAPQLTEWLVMYQGVPEGVVRADTLGEDKYKNIAANASSGSISTTFAFQNIAQQPFADSITARIALIGVNGFTEEVKIKPLAKNELGYIPYTFATRNLSGKYTLQLFVNPRLQPEQNYTNNVLEIPFNITPGAPPLLEVAFDGQHILDGDIVSPDPVITIAVKDEDKYTFLKDPDALEILIRRPNSASFETVNVTTGEIKVFPGDKKNDFRIEYQPQNLVNGLYALRVQAKDVSNNKAGFEPYEISFNVINESTITNFYPYPNPLSSKTRFVFTLTGAQIPQNLKIQILTVTGKVIREITKEELGPLKIGNNTSEYAWDGTDQFGDKLANGVYLYRVVMDSDLFTHRATTGDKSFKKGYGKLYILR